MANTTIAEVTSYDVRTFTDTGQIQASCSWVDTAGNIGHTTGQPDNEHMKALLFRAHREGASITIDGRQLGSS